MKYSTIMAIGIESGTYGSLYVSDFPFSGVYRFSTSLSSWTPTGSFTPAVKEARHIKVHPSNNNYIYVCSDQGIYRSINGGVSWILVKSGKYENIDFMPRTGGSGLYPYYIYAAGHNTFDVSSDDGLTFSPVTSVLSFFSSYTDVFPDLDYTIGETANEHYLYIYAAIKASSISLDYPATQTSTTAYALYRFKYDALLGTETVTKLIIYRDVTNSEDRLAITADKGIAYFGGECFGKYNSYSGGFYQLYNTGNDVLIGTSSTISNYGSFAHPDFHDALLLPLYNRVLISDDGGVHVNNYSTTASPGVYSNLCSPKNNGLHISQVCAMSGTDDDPDLFMTGEQDTKVFKSHAGGITDFSHGTEPFTVMMDRLNADRYFYGSYQ